MSHYRIESLHKVDITKQQYKELDRLNEDMLTAASLEDEDAEQWCSQQLRKLAERICMQAGKPLKKGQDFTYTKTLAGARYIEVHIKHPY